MNVKPKNPLKAYTYEKTRTILASLLGQVRTSVRCKEKGWVFFFFLLNSFATGAQFSFLFAVI